MGRNSHCLKICTAVPVSGLSQLIQRTGTVSPFDNQSRWSFRSLVFQSCFGHQNRPALAPAPIALIELYVERHSKMISTPTNHPSEYVKPNSPILSSDEISLSATLHLKGKVALGMPYAAIPLVTNWLLNQSSNTSSCGASCTARPAQKSWKSGSVKFVQPNKDGHVFRNRFGDDGTKPTSLRLMLLSGAQELRSKLCALRPRRPCSANVQSARHVR